MAEYLFNEPQYHDASAAREHLEAVRWPNGPVCPHCGAVDRISKLQGKAHRPGVYDCGHCRDQFTVTVGTVFERSKISLDKWLFAAALMASSKKGVSSKQVERMIGVTYKTAWFMTMRLREAMKAPGGMFSAGGATIEADETYVGGKAANDHWISDKTLRDELSDLAEDVRDKSKHRNDYAHGVFGYGEKPGTFARFLFKSSHHRVNPDVEILTVDLLKKRAHEAADLWVRSQTLTVKLKSSRGKLK